MKSAVQSTLSPVSHERAEWLKQQLRDFATAGALCSRFDQLRKMLPETADKHEMEALIDYFLFDWFDENGQSAINHFIASNEDITESEREILLDWTDSLSSVFEIRSLGKNSLSLIDLDSNETFQVTTRVPLTKSALKRSQCLSARLLPFGDKFIFSGIQIIMPDRRSAIEEVQIRRSLDRLYSPEALEKAQREQCGAFCEFFGCDEISVTIRDLNSRMEQFQRYLLIEHRDPETGKTAAETFREEFGHDLILPEMEPIPSELTHAEEVTILCDEFDGLVLLPDYQRFKRIFSTDHPDRDVPGWQELLWKYIKDPDIPIVAFERIAEHSPKRMQKVLRVLLGKRTFSIDHLYAMLLHYKQPVEGLDTLKDDERLWDIFDGRKKPARKRTASRKKKPASVPKKRVATKKRAAAKKTVRPAAKSKARKVAVKATRKASARKR
ncbi:MAG TPA: hypothetical protein VID27_01080 [Blastocatellia bacterium]